MISRIQEVWADNLDEEMANIRLAVEKSPFVAMDTEFPGVVARPIGQFKSTSDYHYQTLRCNVDLLNIIQLGLTLTDEYGQLHDGVCTWQFNFKFSMSADMYAPESIDLLTKSGLNFQKHEDMGIDVSHFGELLISSGLVLLDDVRWISFHSGYDFGYLLKLVSCSALPASEKGFFELLKLWFPKVYDIKYLMKACRTLKGGLQDVADDLDVVRIGPQHQAGSDSLLTSTTFFKMRSKFFDEEIDDKYLNVLYGLGTSLSSTRDANSGVWMPNHYTKPSVDNTIGFPIHAQSGSMGAVNGSNNENSDDSSRPTPPSTYRNTPSTHSTPIPERATSAIPINPPPGRPIPQAGAGSNAVNGSAMNSTPS